MKPTRERLKSARIGFSVSRGSSLTSFSLSLGIPEVDTSSMSLYILSEIPDPDSHLSEDTNWLIGAPQMPAHDSDTTRRSHKRTGHHAKPTFRLLPINSHAFSSQSGKPKRRIAIASCR